MPRSPAATSRARLKDWRKDNREDRRSERQREIELEDERRHRDAEFQRETLLELQERLQHVLVKGAASISERRRAAERDGIAWRDALLSAESGEEIRQLNARVFVLQARVKDARLRELIDAVGKTNALRTFRRSRHHPQLRCGHLGGVNPLSLRRQCQVVNGQSGHKNCAQ